MNALDIQNLEKEYNGGIKAVKGISFSISKGDFFALLGPNGAGKSTTINIISSLVNKSSGDIKVFDANLDKDVEKVKSYIGLVPQEFNFNIFEKVLDIVVNQAGYYGVPRKIALKRAEKLLKKLDLWHKRDEISQKLSGGMKRKLMIARALVHEPKLLILDEPTAGVDVETRHIMWEFIKEINKKGTTIILTTHYLEEAEQLCKNIAIIDHGKVIEDTSMKNLLKGLDGETVLLELLKPVKKVKEIRGWEIKKVDSKTLEVSISKGKDVGSLIKALSKQGITVSRVNNKTNRLEELFVKLTRRRKNV